MATPSSASASSVVVATAAGSAGTTTSQALVLAALETLYQSQLNPQQQQQADAFLRDFQLTPHAFDICAQLLHEFLPSTCCCCCCGGGSSSSSSSSTNNRGLHSANNTNQSFLIAFFAAQTLANKLRRQHAFSSTFPAGYSVWTTQLINWLTCASSTAGNCQHNPTCRQPNPNNWQIPRRIQTQLVLALVSCLPRLLPHEIAETLSAMNVSTESSSASGIVGFGMHSSSGALGFVMTQLSQAHVSSRVLVEVLALVVEEMCELQDYDTRERMQKEIDTWAPVVMDNLLPQFMQDAANQLVQQQGAQDDSLMVQQQQQQLVLQALKSWVRYASLSCQQVVQNPIVQSLFRLLSHEQLFDASVDVLVEIMRTFCEADRDFVLIQWLVPQIMSLRPLLGQSIQDENLDQVMGLARIFTEMAESYIALLVGQHDLQQQILVDLLLDCMGFDDIDVTDLMIPFWYRFFEEINSIGDDATKKLLVDKFHTSLCRLASICMDKLQFADDFPTLPSDKQQDFKSFRQDLGDLLRECCELLGAQTILQHCVNGLQSIFQTADGNTGNWQAIEAHLYCFRSIARHVERSSQLVENAALLHMMFSHLPQFPDHPSIRYTSCLIISRYADWFRTNQQLLPAQLQFLHQTIVNSKQQAGYGEWEVLRAAATALGALATDCWQLIGQDMLQFYCEMEQHEVMPVEDQVLVLQGICHGISESESLPTVDLLRRIVEPSVQRIVALMTNSSTLHATQARCVEQELLRYMCVYEHLDVDTTAAMESSSSSSSAQHPLLFLTEVLWPVFNQVLAVFATNDEIVERVCRCYKRMLRSCGRQFKPFVPQLVENIVRCFQHEPKGSYFYCGSMIIKFFHHEKEFTAGFEQMLTQFAESTFPIFTSADGFANNPELVEEFFYLMERAVQCLPSQLFATGHLPDLLNCAIASLEVPHNEANKAALCFLEKLVQITNDDFARSSGMAGFAQFMQQLRQSSIGQQLVAQLVRSVVCARLAPSRIEADYGSVGGVFVQLARFDGSWFHQSVAAELEQLQQQVDWLWPQEQQKFVNSLVTSQDERTFRRAIRHFGRFCHSRTSSTTAAAAKPHGSSTECNE